MLKNEGNKILFSMESFDESIHSVILGALFGATTSNLTSGEEETSQFISGDTLNMFPDVEFGSRFYTFLVNAKSNETYLEEANNLLLSALSFLIEDGILSDISSEPEIIDEKFYFTLTLTFNNKIEVRTLAFNTRETNYNKE